MAGFIISANPITEAEIIEGYTINSTQDTIKVKFTIKYNGVDNTWGTVGLTATCDKLNNSAFSLPNGTKQNYIKRNGGYSSETPPVDYLLADVPITNGDALTFTLTPFINGSTHPVTDLLPTPFTYVLNVSEYCHKSNNINSFECDPIIVTNNEESTDVIATLHWEHIPNETSETSIFDRVVRYDIYCEESWLGDITLPKFIRRDPSKTSYTYEYKLSRITLFNHMKKKYESSGVKSEKIKFTIIAVKAGLFSSEKKVLFADVVYERPIQIIDMWVPSGSATNQDNLRIRNDMTYTSLSDDGSAFWDDYGDNYSELRIMWETDEIPTSTKIKAYTYYGEISANLNIFRIGRESDCNLSENYSTHYDDKGNIIGYIAGYSYPAELNRTAFEFTGDIAPAGWDGYIKVEINNSNQFQTIKNQYGKVYTKTGANSYQEATIYISNTNYYVQNNIYQTFDPTQKPYKHFNKNNKVIVYKDYKFVPSYSKKYVFQCISQDGDTPSQISDFFTRTTKWKRISGDTEFEPEVAVSMNTTRFVAFEVTVTLKKNGVETYFKKRSQVIKIKRHPIIRNFKVVDSDLGGQFPYNLENGFNVNLYTIPDGSDTDLATSQLSWGIDRVTLAEWLGLNLNTQNKTLSELISLYSKNFFNNVLTTYERTRNIISPVWFDLHLVIKSDYYFDLVESNRPDNQLDVILVKDEPIAYEYTDGSKTYTPKYEYDIGEYDKDFVDWLLSADHEHHIAVDKDDFAFFENLNYKTINNYNGSIKMYYYKENGEYIYDSTIKNKNTFNASKSEHTTIYYNKNYEKLIQVVLAQVYSNYTPKIFSSKVKYAKNDAVQYNNRVYICLVAGMYNTYDLSNSSLWENTETTPKTYINERESVKEDINFDSQSLKRQFRELVDCGYLTFRLSQYEYIPSVYLQKYPVHWECPVCNYNFVVAEVNTNGVMYVFDGYDESSYYKNVSTSEAITTTNKHFNTFRSARKNFKCPKCGYRPTDYDLDVVEDFFEKLTGLELTNIVDIPLPKLGHSKVTYNAGSGQQTKTLSNLDLYDYNNRLDKILSSLFYKGSNDTSDAFYNLRTVTNALFSGDLSLIDKNGKLNVSNYIDSKKAILNSSDKTASTNHCDSNTGSVSFKQLFDTTAGYIKEFRDYYKAECATCGHTLYLDILYTNNSKIVCPYCFSSNIKSAIKNQDGNSYENAEDSTSGDNIFNIIAGAYQDSKTTAVDTDFINFYHKMGRLDLDIMSHYCPYGDIIMLTPDSSDSVPVIKSYELYNNNKIHIAFTEVKDYGDISGFNITIGYTNDNSDWYTPTDIHNGLEETITEPYSIIGDYEIIDNTSPDNYIKDIKYYELINGKYVNANIDNVNDFIGFNYEIIDNSDPTNYDYSITYYVLVSGNYIDAEINNVNDFTSFVGTLYVYVSKNLYVSSPLTYVLHSVDVPMSGIGEYSDINYFLVADGSKYTTVSGNMIIDKEKIKTLIEVVNNLHEEDSGNLLVSIEIRPYYNVPDGSGNTYRLYGKNRVYKKNDDSNNNYKYTDYGIITYLTGYFPLFEVEYTPTADPFLYSLYPNENETNIYDFSPEIYDLFGYYPAVNFAYNPNIDYYIYDTEEDRYVLVEVDDADEYDELKSDLYFIGNPYKGNYHWYGAKTPIITNRLMLKASEDTDGSYNLDKVSVIYGNYTQVQSGDTFDQNKIYFTKQGNDYIYTYVDSETFADLVQSGLYINNNVLNGVQWVGSDITLGNSDDYIFNITKIQYFDETTEYTAGDSAIYVDDNPDTQANKTGTYTCTGYYKLSDLENNNLWQYLGTAKALPTSGSGDSDIIYLNTTDDYIYFYDGDTHQSYKYDDFDVLDTTTPGTYNVNDLIKVEDSQNHKYALYECVADDTHTDSAGIPDSAFWENIEFGDISGTFETYYNKPLPIFNDSVVYSNGDTVIYVGNDSKFGVVYECDYDSTTHLTNGTIALSYSNVQLFEINNQNATFNPNAKYYHHDTPTTFEELTFADATAFAQYTTDTVYTANVWKEFVYNSSDTYWVHCGTMCNNILRIGYNGTYQYYTYYNNSYQPYIDVSSILGAPGVTNHSILVTCLSKTYGSDVSVSTTTSGVAVNAFYTNGTNYYEKTRDNTYQSGDLSNTDIWTYLGDYNLFAPNYKLTYGGDLYVQNSQVYVELISESDLNTWNNVGSFNVFDNTTAYVAGNIVESVEDNITKYYMCLVDGRAYTTSQLLDSTYWSGSLGDVSPILCTQDISQGSYPLINKSGEWYINIKFNANSTVIGSLSQLDGVKIITHFSGINNSQLPKEYADTDTTHLVGKAYRTTGTLQFKFYDMVKQNSPADSKIFSDTLDMDKANAKYCPTCHKLYPYRLKHYFDESFPITIEDDKGNENTLNLYDEMDMLDEKAVKSYSILNNKNIPEDINDFKKYGSLTPITTPADFTNCLECGTTLTSVDDAITQGLIESIADLDIDYDVDNDELNSEGSYWTIRALEAFNGFYGNHSPAYNKIMRNHGINDGMYKLMLQNLSLSTDSANAFTGGDYQTHTNPIQIKKFDYENSGYKDRVYAETKIVSTADTGTFDAIDRSVIEELKTVLDMQTNP